jgi:hypothetical protein
VIADSDAADSQRAVCTNPEAFFTAKLLRFHYPTAPEPEVAADDEGLEAEEMPAPVRRQSSTISAAEEAELRGLWAKEFVTKGGFAYVLNDFMTADLNRADSTAENVDLKYIAFKLQVLRTFLMAAIANTDLDAYEVSQMVRRQSSTVDEKQKEDGKGAADGGFEQLKGVLSGDVADQTLEGIDFGKL